MQAAIPTIATGQEGPASEYEVKAAMLYKLTSFVEWPSSAHSDPQGPTVFCVLGRDPLGDFLASMVFMQAANGRPAQIRRLQNAKEVRGCHVLYISTSERKNVAQIFSGLKGTNVLTVGEMAQFAEGGGMIQFSLEEKRVRFAINLDAASRADLKISSRLLALARIVKEGAGNSGSNRNSIDSLK